MAVVVIADFANPLEQDNLLGHYVLDFCFFDIVHPFK